MLLGEMWTRFLVMCVTVATPKSMQILHNYIIDLGIFKFPQSNRYNELLKQIKAKNI